MGLGADFEELGGISQQDADFFCGFGVTPTDFGV